MSKKYLIIEDEPISAMYLKSMIPLRKVRIFYK